MSTEPGEYMSPGTGESSVFPNTYLYQSSDAPYSYPSVSYSAGTGTSSQDGVPLLSATRPTPPRSKSEPNGTVVSSSERYFIILLLPIPCFLLTRPLKKETYRENRHFRLFPTGENQNCIS